jgi:hypothetical protein
VTALLDFALYSFLPYYLGSLDLYGYRTIVNTHGSPQLPYRNICLSSHSE